MNPSEEIVAGEEWRHRGSIATESTTPQDREALALAEERIPHLRQGSAVVKLLDSQGHPLAGVPLQIEQKRHHFPFGDQLWGLDALYRNGQWETDRAIAWRRRFTEVFNAATSLCYWTERPQNDASKTEDYQGMPRVENFATTLEWALSAGLIAKGHPLFWSIPKCTPDWVQRYDPSTFYKFAECRVRSLVARFRGRVTFWDAVNEPLWEAAPENLAARQWPHFEPVPVMADYIERVLDWCRSEDPAARYLVNDYGLEEDQAAWQDLRANTGELVSAGLQRRRFLALLEELARRGSAPDAVGMQAHTGMIGPAAQAMVYDELATSGLPLHVTEFWIDGKILESADTEEQVRKENAAASYLQNYLTVAFGHPAIEAFFCWGLFGQAVTWKEFSGHRTNALFEVMREFFQRRHNTQYQQVTDAKGEVHFVGYYGDYGIGYALRNGQRRYLACSLRRNQTNHYEFRIPQPLMPR